MKRTVLSFLCLVLAGSAPRCDGRAPIGPREVMDGPYTMAYRVFAGDYRDNGPVFARLAADLEAAGITSTRSVGIYLRDPKTTAPQDLLCVCGAVIEEKDWTRIEGLSPAFRIMHIPRAMRIVCQYPVTGPQSYIDGGARCYPLLAGFAKRHGRTPLGAYEVYDSGRIISYVMRTVEKEADYPPAGTSAGRSASEGSASASWPDPDWQTSTPEAQGMDSLQLARTLDLVPSLWDLGEIDSLLIIRRGRIVLEVYFHPNKPGLRHELHSVTKSVTSTLLGIAVRKGLVRVDDPVLSYFRGRAFDNMSGDKAAMTVRNLLNMRSGLEFQEFPLTGSDNSHARMLRSHDWAEFSLGLPMAARPGSRFNYSDGDMAILSGILDKATGGGISELAAQQLFAPLGIDNYEWRKDPKGNPMPNDGLFLTPRDQAKIGYLYLRGGMWRGGRILPEEWVRDIQTASVGTAGWAVPRYGMLWWVDATGSLFSASGSAGQYIIVMPRQDIVAVVNAKQGAVEDAPGFLEIAHELILPAVRTDGALPENAGGFRQLQERIRRFESPPARPVPRPPDTAARVSGKRILLDPNPSGVTSVTLRFDAGKAAASVEMVQNGGTVRFPVGLDGIQKTGGPMGAEMFSSFGYWDDDQDFCIESRVLQGDFLDRMRFRFSGDAVRVTLVVGDELWQSFSIGGRLAD